MVRQKPPDTSTVHRTSNELVKLIRKLRWMGMDEEAKKLQNELTRRRAITCGQRARNVRRDGLAASARSGTPAHGGPVVPAFVAMHPVAPECSRQCRL
jgi:hypothetical protein